MNRTRKPAIKKSKREKEKEREQIEKQNTKRIRNTKMKTMLPNTANDQNVKNSKENILKNKHTHTHSNKITIDE